MFSYTMDKLDRFSAVIFDCDGVILDSEPLHYQAYLPFFERYGIILNYEDYLRRYVGLSDREMLPRILIDYGLSFESQNLGQFLIQKAAMYAQMISKTREMPLVPGVEEYVATLFRQGKKMAVCSGGSRREVMTVLQQLKHPAASRYFETVVTAEDVRQGKPSPEGYLLTAERLAVDPKECLVFEDTPHGIQAAQSAGMQVIGLATTRPRAHLKAASHIIQNFFELTDLSGMTGITDPEISDESQQRNG